MGLQVRGPGSKSFQAQAWQCSSGLGVWGLGLRVLGFLGSGFRVFGFRAWGLGSLGFGAWGFWGLRLQDPGLLPCRSG